MANENSPDILGHCETFLTTSVSDSQVSSDVFDLIRKNRSDIQDKTGSGIILYTRKALHCMHRQELEISKIESIWVTITLPNSKPVVICTIHRLPGSSSGLIDLLEENINDTENGSRSHSYHKNTPI